MNSHINDLCSIHSVLTLPFNYQIYFFSHLDYFPWMSAPLFILIVMYVDILQ